VCQYPSGWAKGRMMVQFSPCDRADVDNTPISFGNQEVLSTVSGSVELSDELDSRQPFLQIEMVHSCPDTLLSPLQWP
jgi:hypothetical protein